MVVIRKNKMKKRVIKCKNPKGKMQKNLCSAILKPHPRRVDLLDKKGNVIQVHFVKKKK